MINTEHWIVFSDRTNSRAIGTVLRRVRRRRLRRYVLWLNGAS